MRCKPGRCHFAGHAVVMALALGSDEPRRAALPIHGCWTAVTMRKRW